ncbi:hypothetical protein A3K79_01325 [Candidatus Bathyarchaeota archaeon RBG_13_46_16b]|nr:MAG: hypothetical protein A3K79_01325 [Candidatus Bathyarchaeota archaeon RBG_13_46_16b]
MTGKIRELMAWELQESWAFPILELILAVTIIQVLPFFMLSRGDADIISSVSMPFWKSMAFVFAISAAVISGRSYGESIEKRKMVVLLEYPVSRFQVFISKFLANLLSMLCVFGSALLVEGILAWMFEPTVTWSFYQVWFADYSIAPAIWGFMFVSMFLVVFFASSLMSFLALATKRFGLSVLIFLVYIFGLEYWTETLSNKVPEAYLSLVQGPIGIVNYLSQEYFRVMGLGKANLGTAWPLFLTAFSYLLVGGIVLLCASMVLMRRMDLD